MTAAEKFRKLLKADGRYASEAYSFVYEALDYTLKHIVRSRRGAQEHVSGPQLLEGVRLLGIERFGCLARAVLESWGVHRTDDFGEIVFNLVDHDLMGKQESDSREDFRDVYDFEEVFDLVPLFHYARDRGEWVTSYVSRRDYATLQR